MTAVFTALVSRWTVGDVSSRVELATWHGRARSGRRGVAAARVPEVLILLRMVHRTLGIVTHHMSVDQSGKLLTGFYGGTRLVSSTSDMRKTRMSIP